MPSNLSITNTGSGNPDKNAQESTHLQRRQVLKGALGGVRASWKLACVLLHLVRGWWTVVFRWLGSVSRYDLMPQAGRELAIPYLLRLTRRFNPTWFVSNEGVTWFF